MENSESTERQQADLSATGARDVRTTPTEHVEPSPGPVEPEPEPAQTLPSESPAPKGRPQGSKDRQPRTRRPTIRVESLPTPEPVAEPAKPSRAQPRAAPTPAATPPEPLEEPPSPQTLYRETSERLVHLRGLLNESRRSVVADKYTSRLSSWAV
jgi:hypothetical protein